MPKQVLHLCDGLSLHNHDGRERMPQRMHGYTTQTRASEGRPESVAQRIGPANKVSLSRRENEVVIGNRTLDFPNSEGINQPTWKWDGADRPSLTADSPSTIGIGNRRRHSLANGI